MSGKINKAAVVSTIILLALVFLYNGPVFASEKDDITGAAVKYYSGEAGTRVYDIRTAGNWAAVFIECTSKSGDVWKGQVLLKKANGKWKGVRGTSRNMITPALKASGVPEALWNKLLDPAWIAKSAPLTSALGDKGRVHTNLRISGEWAFGAWEQTDKSGETIGEGVTLLHLKNGKWTIVTSGGGAMSDNELKQYGVPEKNLKELLDR
ncbi:MAG: hypothetical protein LWY06_02155 [Firmicutes bacterium]|nr:hypothetical protein [Bacillota bacterium]